MKKRTLLIFALHLAIVLAYTTLAGYLFVTYKETDPVGTGLQQAALFILHFIVTGLVCLVIRMNATDKKAAETILVTNLAAVIFWVFVSLVLSNLLWSYLWTLRPH